MIVQPKVVFSATGSPGNPTFCPHFVLILAYSLAPNTSFLVVVDHLYSIQVGVLLQKIFVSRVTKFHQMWFVNFAQVDLHAKISISCTNFRLENLHSRCGQTQKHVDFQLNFASVGFFCSLSNSFAEAYELYAPVSRSALHFTPST